MYQKWRNQIFPVVSFVFPHDGHFGLGRGGGAPLVVSRSKRAYGQWTSCKAKRDLGRKDGVAGARHLSVGTEQV